MRCTGEPREDDRVVVQGVIHPAIGVHLLVLGRRRIVGGLGGTRSAEHADRHREDDDGGRYQ